MSAGPVSSVRLLALLALKSLRARRGVVLLAAMSIGLSVALFLTVDRFRTAAKASFASVISDTDVIVGARGGDVQLLLYSVFRLGSATNNFTWRTYQDIAAHPAVDWIVPLSLGDSHRGFRVLGAPAEFFERYRYRKGQSLRFAQGRPYAELFEAVIGAEVADALGYQLGDQIIVAHGIGSADLALHDNAPFTIVGVLARSGTPADRTVQVSLEAIEAIHVDWRGGAQAPTTAPEVLAQMALTPKAVTAALVGLTTRLQTFQFQRYVNEYRQEAMTATLPGLALQELWTVVGAAESALLAVSACVVVAAALGLSMMLMATLNERRREMAVLRSVGVGPAAISAMLVLEATAISAAGAVLGMVIHYVLFAVAGGWLDRSYGLYIATSAPDMRMATALLVMVLVGALSALAPAYQAYRLSVADGLGLRL